MKFSRRSAAFGAVVAAGLLGSMSAAGAGPMPSAAGSLVAGQGAASLVEEVQFRGGRGGPRVVRRGGGRGAALGAGIAAGILGGIAAGALMNRPAYAAPEPVYEPGPAYDPYERRPVYVAPRRGGGDAVEYCMRRFRSYDPRTGTYVGLDGVERACP